MLRKIGSRWWLIVLSTIACVGAAAVINNNMVPLYTGRATLLETRNMPADEQALLGTLSTVASGNQAMQDAVETLRDRGSAHTPAEILQAIAIMPVKGKQALSVDVALPDPAESKKAAGIVAASAKKAWEELYGSKGSGYSVALVPKGHATWLELRGRSAGKTPAAATNRPPLATLVRIANSDRVMQYTFDTLRDLGLRYDPHKVTAATSIKPVTDTYILAIEVTLPDPIEAKTAADVVAASVKKAYRELYGPKDAEQESRLKTVDPACVFPVNQHKMLRLEGALVGGLVLGIVLAAILPKAGRRESDVAIRTEGSTS